MDRRVACAAFIALLCVSIDAAAQQGTGPGEVARPRAEAPDGVKLVGCVLPEAKPNAFRFVLAPPGKDAAAPKLPKGLKAGASLELIARGETNLQPFANQKIEVTGKLTDGRRRLEVVDARPIGVCDPPAPSSL